MIQFLIALFPEGYSDIQTTCFRAMDIIEEGFDLEDYTGNERKISEA